MRNLGQLDGAQLLCSATGIALESVFRRFARTAGLGTRHGTCNYEKPNTLFPLRFRGDRLEGSTSVHRKLEFLYILTTRDRCAHATLYHLYPLRITHVALAGESRANRRQELLNSRRIRLSRQPKWPVNLLSIPFSDVLASNLS